MRTKLKRIFLPILCVAVLLSGVVTATAAPDPEQPVLYGIGSTSKMFTAAAVMQLAGEGKIDLDAPLTGYLPAFTMADERYRLITPRMLLNHSSGLQGSCYRNSMLLGDNDSFAHDTLLAQLSVQRLKADPGAFSVYCNDGFTLAELLVEQVSGESFSDYLQRHIFAPLGLRHTGTPLTAFDRSLLAPIYYNDALLPHENANVIGSGGVYATAEDLCRFARIFTRGYDGPVLSQQSALEMEEASFTGGAWAASPDSGASMAYGLGWDTVNAYPFGDYGIKAVSKGGDTTAYHASLIVLPEENLSCAVLSSGGSGTFCNIAAQEILLEYLRETGRLTDSAAPSAESAQTAVTAEPVPGWYASRQQAIHVAADGGTLTLTSAGTDRDTTQQYNLGNDGVYRASGVAYISPEGKLVEAQDGTRGETALTFGKDEAGTPYLLTDTTETLPGLGKSRGSVPFAQLVEANPLPPDIETQWEARTGKRFYMVSDKHTSTLYLNNPSTQPRTIEGLPGYFVLDGSGPCPLLTRIADQDNARFFQTIPGQAGRDLSDIRFYREDGIEKMDTQNYRFIPEEAVEPLGERQNVTVGARGETVWLSVETDGSRSVSLTAPENSNFFIYSVERDGLSCTASSLAGQNGQPVHLPQNCRIAFAGVPGSTLAIDWQGEAV